MNITRRLFLRNATAASAVAASVAAPAIAEARTVEENSELLRIDAEFRAAVAALDRAEAAKRAAVARYAEIAPPLPADLLFTFADRDCHIRCIAERDLFGGIVFPDDARKPPRMLVTARSLGDHIDRHGMRRSRSKYANECRRRHRVAVQYETACDIAREQCGIENALRQCDIASTVLQKLLWGMNDQQARTWAGLAIKANAILTAPRFGTEMALIARNASSSMHTRQSPPCWNSRM